VTQLARISLLVSFAVPAAWTAPAPAPSPAPAAASRPVYVQDFEALVQESGSSRGGPLSRRREGRASKKAWKSAGSLSSAIADEFKAAGYPSQRIARDAPLPTSGWLVTGTFYALDSQSGAIRVPSFLSGGSPAPNTQVTVSIADLAVNPTAPFIVFGTAEALRGQEAPAGWNPYVVAAKFVVNKVESSGDIEKLAKEIVATIMKNKETVEEKARAQSQ
jgi:hypothetical protein